jgi:N-acetylneuraminate synthase/N,N'-diacetyllegionaminate synthase
MRVICIVPARGGSKGIPGKNLRLVGGASLVARAVLAARTFVRASALADARVIVDTDAEDIAREAVEWGAEVPFLRAHELASETSSSVASTLGLLDRLEAKGEEFDAVVLLQPTSPLRTADDIGECWRAFIQGTRSVTTISPEDHPSALSVRVRDGERIEWVNAPANDGLRRQDIATVYRLTGAVYVTAVDVLRREKAFVVSGLTRGIPVPDERSIDIDLPVDLDAAEGVLRGRPTPLMTLGRWTIGQGHPCFVIAEAGVNHNGRTELAHRLIEAAVSAGADAVKFQTFDPELLVADSAPKAEYQLATTGAADSQREMLDALALPHAAFRELAEHARSSSILFLSTPFDERSADFLVELGCEALKIASGEVTNARFLAALARKGVPLLMSSGMATLAEVARAVEVIRENGAPPLSLFHCVTNYPADPADCNLRAMDAMRLTFDVPVGWSDHTVGSAVTVAAVALGADMVEKHFTIDRTMTGPDHASSLEPAELADMVAAIRAAASARGTGVKRPAASELANLTVVRRSLHMARGVSAGEVLAASDLIALRPAGGFPPSAERNFVGRRALRALRKGEMLRDGDVA